MMPITWIVRSAQPPECTDKISCTSPLDAARGWAERMFKRGMLPHNGTEVLVRAEGDSMPRHSTYRVKISIVNAPAFKATFAGLAFEGVNGDPRNGSHGE